MHCLLSTGRCGALRKPQARRAGTSKKDTVGKDPVGKDSRRVRRPAVVESEGLPLPLGEGGGEGASRARKCISPRQAVTTPHSQGA
jgi:hypothetical protein